MRLHVDVVYTQQMQIPLFLASAYVRSETLSLWKYIHIFLLLLICCAFK